MPVTVFNQTITVGDSGSGPFPFQANYWDIGADFSLATGYGGQFDGALKLKVGATDFPSNQDYSELTYYIVNPFQATVTTADSLVVADVTNAVSTDATLITGNYSAALGSISDARIFRLLDFTAATGAITLSWNDSVIANRGNMANEPDPTYRVVVRDTGGNILRTLFSTTTSSPVSNPPHTADLTAYAGQSVVLAFERFGSVKGNSVSIDDVSILDGASTQFVTNGDFETGDLSDWFVNDPEEIQNITSGARTLEGLSVRRSFYTLPSQLWGRWVDVFENNTGSPISKTVTYTTNLGSNGTGIIYGLDGNGNIYTFPDPNIKALTSWDGNGNVRDVGIVFAGASGTTLPTVTFTSDDGLGNGNGSDIIEETFNITVPAGDSFAIAHFVVMDATRTFDTASSVGDPAADIDTVVEDIVSNISAYTDGIPPLTRTIVNF
jgi:hypothetical protein